MAIDPVCGMMVDEARAGYRTQYKGETYYFCKVGCMIAFDRDPEKYIRRLAIRQGMRRKNAVGG